ncbi:MAG: heparan-alpha-glucosaminide N-acetyltransferase domain-containing protein, partial [Pseudomonadota bacterium]
MLDHPVKSTRLTSIDIVRGLVIVIMALDHIRDMTSAPQGPSLDFDGAPWPLFFTRWISHFCAPTFVMLAGVSAFLYGSHHHTRGDLSRFLLTRGIWLVCVEIVFVSLAWNFNVLGE